MNIILHVIKDVFESQLPLPKTHTSNYILEFFILILKQFGISTKTRKALSLVQIFLCFPEFG